MGNFFLLGECKGVLAVPLSSQAESFKTLQEKESTKGVQARTNITEEFSSNFKSKRSGTECLAELETMVALSRFGEAGKFSGLCPIEFTLEILISKRELNKYWRNSTWVDDNPSNGCSMASYPFCGTVYYPTTGKDERKDRMQKNRPRIRTNDIGAVLDRSNEVS